MDGSTSSEKCEWDSNIGSDASSITSSETCLSAKGSSEYKEAVEKVTEKVLCTLCSLNIPLITF